MARRRPPAALAMDAGGGALALRERVLALAGVTLAEQARLARSVIDSTVSALSATAAMRLVLNDGRGRSKVNEYFDIDWGHRLRAVAVLVDVLGLKPSRSDHQTSRPPLAIQINLQQPPTQPQVRVIADVSAAAPADATVVASVDAVRR